VKKYNVHYKTVKRRIKKGWNPIIAITTPTQKRLTNKVVLNIRNSFLPRKDLAIKYKCSISTIALIKNKTTWANI
jgi:DNA invertase Pin-like site-specific DNA recombinase